MAETQKGKKTSKSLREFSSGGVVFKKNGLDYFWLVSKSSPSRDYPHSVWRLQKGWIDETVDGVLPGPISSGKIKATEEQLQLTALREVKEEGGINARIVTKIGTERFVFNSKPRNGMVFKFVTFYLMEWLSDVVGGPGFETSETKWLPYEDARKILTHSGEKKVLDKAKSVLESGVQGNLL